MARDEVKALLRMTEENLTPRMKARRDAFIAEYLVDWSGPNAMIRSGGSPSTACKLARQYLHEPYVAKKIRECIDALEEAGLINRKRVLAGLVREANYHGIGASHGARVSAYGVLAKILGMEAAQKVDVKVGVMVVPMAATPEDWEKQAIEGQAKLKSDVRD